jgi:hypothetical protein
MSRRQWKTIDLAFIVVRNNARVKFTEETESLQQRLSHRTTLEAFLIARMAAGSRAGIAPNFHWQAFIQLPRCIPEDVI